MRTIIHLFFRTSDCAAQINCRRCLTLELRNKWLVGWLPQLYCLSIVYSASRFSLHFIPCSSPHFLIGLPNSLSSNFPALQFPPFLPSVPICFFYSSVHWHFNGSADSRHHSLFVCSFVAVVADHIKWWKEKVIVWWWDCVASHQTHKPTNNTICQPSALCCRVRQKKFQKNFIAPFCPHAKQ